MANQVLEALQGGTVAAERETVGGTPSRPTFTREAIMATPPAPPPALTGPSLVAPTGPQPTFNPEREETSFLERAGAGAKLTPTGRVGFIERNRVGDVFTDEAGTVFIYDRQANEVYPFDRPTFTVQDIFDVTADIGQAGLQLLGAPTVVGQAAIGAIGEAGRQLLTEILPGEEDLDIEDRLIRLGATSAGAGLGQGAVNLGFRAIDRLRPTNFVRRAFQRSLEEPAGAEGLALAEQTGVPLTPGQISGNRGLLQMEGFLAQHPVTSNRAYQAAQNRLRTAYRNLSEQINRLSPRGAIGRETAGGEIQAGFRGLVDDMIAQRARVAEADFGLIDEMGGGVVPMDTRQAIAAMDSLIAENQVAGAGPVSKRIVNALREARAELLEEGVNAQGFQKLLNRYGRGAAGTGRIFDDLSTADDRRVAGTIFRGLLDDLAAMADEGNYAAPVAEALQIARNNYRQASQGIQQMQDSVLGQMFRGRAPVTPEQAAARVSRMAPSELRATTEMLEQARGPQFTQDLKAFLLADALAGQGARRSTRAPAAALEEEAPRSVAKRLVNSPVWEILSETERGQIAAGVEVLQRLADDAGIRVGGSQTAPLLMTRELIEDIARFSPSSLVQTIGANRFPSAAFRLLLEPGSVEALRTLRTTSPGTRRYVNAAQFLGGLLADTAGREQVRPAPPETSQPITSPRAPPPGRRPNTILQSLPQGQTP